MMISNELQYRVSLNYLSRLAAHYAAVLEPEPEDADVDERLLLAEREGVRNRLLTVIEELTEYEQRRGQPGLFFTPAPARS